MSSRRSSQFLRLLHQLTSLSGRVLDELVSRGLVSHLAASLDQDPDPDPDPQKVKTDATCREDLLQASICLSSVLCAGGGKYTAAVRNKTGFVTFF